MQKQHKSTTNLIFLAVLFITEGSRRAGVKVRKSLAVGRTLSRDRNTLPCSQTGSAAVRAEASLGKEAELNHACNVYG